MTGSLSMLCPLPYALRSVPKERSTFSGLMLVFQNVKKRNLTHTSSFRPFFPLKVKLFFSEFEFFPLELEFEPGLILFLLPFILHEFLPGFKPILFEFKQFFPQSESLCFDLSLFSF